MASRPQREDELVERRPGSGIHRESAQRDRGNTARELRNHAHGGAQLGEVAAEKRPHAGDRLPQRDAERVDIDALVDRPAIDLLGRHVGRGAGGPGAPFTAADREPEIGDEHAGLFAAHLDEHVVGLEVAMHEPVVVRGREPLGGAAIQREDLGAIAARAVGAQRGTGNELGREVERAFKLAGLVHREHGRVADPRHRAGFLEERAIVVAAHELERYGTPETVIDRLVHHAHAAGAKPAHELERAEVKPARVIAVEPDRRLGVACRRADGDAEAARIADVEVIADAIAVTIGQQLLHEACQLVLAGADGCGLHVAADASAI